MNVNRYLLIAGVGLVLLVLIAGLGVTTLRLPVTSRSVVTSREHREAHASVLLKERALSEARDEFRSAVKAASKKRPDPILDAAADEFIDRVIEIAK